MDNFFKRTWAEINLDAIRHNYTEIKQSLNPDTKICCVVKADGYGHGASFVAKEPTPNNTKAVTTRPQNPPNSLAAQHTGKAAKDPTVPEATGLYPVLNQDASTKAVFL